jgi:hypothetical protein
VWLNFCRRNSDSAEIHRYVAARVTRAAAAIVLVMHASAAAQDVTEPALKAAYIYNFIKFTDWPADALAPRAPLAICVAGDPEIAVALERAVKTRKYGDHALTVLRLTDGGQTRGCHVMWASQLPPKQAASLVAAVRDTPVLTIGDIDGFTGFGGIAFFYFEHGQLRFYVDTAAVKRARLEISSRLLTLSNKP